MHQTYFYEQKLTYSGLNDLADDVSDNTNSHDHTEGVGGTGKKITASGLENSASTEIRDYDAHSPFVVTGLLPVTSGNLISNISSGEGYAPDDATDRLVRVVQESGQSHTYNANKDTYVYLHPYLNIHGSDDGFFHFEEVNNDDPQPSLPDSSTILAKVVTDGSAITSVVALKETSPIFDNSVTTVKVKDSAITFVKTSGIWWEELGTTILSSSADIIIVSGLTAKRFLKILVFLIPDGAIGVGLTFNTDTTGNYARRSSTNGAGDVAVGGVNELSIGSVNTATLGFLEVSVVNILAQEKLVISHEVDANTAGSGNVPTRREIVGKWANTSAVINRVVITNAQAGSYASGSKMVVLGHD